MEGGVFREAGITELLQAPGKLPGNSGTRYVNTNHCQRFLYKAVCWQSNDELRLMCSDSSLRRAWLVGGHRNLQDNLSDLRAQVAANTQGAALMHELIREYTIEVRTLVPHSLDSTTVASCAVSLKA